MACKLLASAKIHHTKGCNWLLCAEQSCLFLVSSWGKALWKRVDIYCILLKSVCPNIDCKWWFSVWGGFYFRLKIAICWSQVKPDDCKPGYSSSWSVESREIICFSSALVTSSSSSSSLKMWIIFGSKMRSGRCVLVAKSSILDVHSCWQIRWICSCSSPFWCGIIQKKCHYFGRKFTCALRTDDNYIVIGKMQYN